MCPKRPRLSCIYAIRHHGHAFSSNSEYGRKMSDIMFPIKGEIGIVMTSIKVLVVNDDNMKTNSIIAETEMRSCTSQLDHYTCHRPSLKVVST